MGYRKLGRTSDQRKAMLRDLATSLIVSERIETTEARAKEVRSVVEKLITLGKKGDLASRRNAAKTCLLYTSPSPRDQRGSRMPSSA